jgi:hypothetical protein
MFEVILPSCNRARLLCRAVNSVLAQTNPDWRLWVLDMSSPEEWERIAKWWSDNHLGEGALKDKCRLIHYDTPKGVVPYSWMTNQVYFQLDKAAWVSYLTDDAWYPPDRFEAFAEEIELHKEKEAIYGEQVRINRGSRRFPSGPQGTVHFMPAYPVSAQELEAHNWIDHNALVHKAELLWTEKEPWVLDLAEIRVGDWRCWQKLIKKTDIYPLKRIVAFDDWHLDGLSEMTALMVKERFGVAQ